jgi:glycosyltransferase 2 family protein
MGGVSQQVDAPRRAMRGGVRPPSARSVLIVFGLAVSLFFGYLAVRDIQPNETWQAFVHTDFVWLVPGTALFALAFLIRAVRWQSLFTPQRRPALWPVVQSLFVGYLANNLLPVRAGEAARVVALNKLSRTSIAESTATVLVERAFDVLSLLLLLFLMLPWLPHITWIQTAAVLALFLLLALAILAVVFMRYGDRPLQFLFRPLAKVSFLPRDSIARAPANFLHGMAGLLNVRVGFVAFAWTTLSWLVLGVSFWCVMEAFHLGLSPLAGLLVVIAIGLAMILPSSPAALGVFEGATVLVLSAYSINSSTALSYALVLHAMNFFPFILVALAVVGLRRVRRIPDVAVEPEPRA